MTFLPLWKARHGYIYVPLVNDNSQSSGGHANPLHNSLPHKSTSLVSWSVFIRLGIVLGTSVPLNCSYIDKSFILHLALICFPYNSTPMLSEKIKRRCTRCISSETFCSKPIVLTPGSGCCCTLVKNTFWICPISLLFHSIQVWKNNSCLVCLLWCPLERGKAINGHISHSNYGIKTQTIKTNYHICRQQW